MPHLPHLDHGAHPVLESVGHAFWALCGAIVVLFIFFAALGAVEPDETLELTIVVLALAVLWLAHAWRGLWRDERS
ncbi:MAG TPA: hypothetical protein VGW14_00425 [Thermoleophilaceae bacterium]|nr:hypothetical protein [Thermoleophilaceae bacterium]